MRIITGFIPPSAGEVRVDGLSVESDSLAVRARLGSLPENTPIYPDMRVAEYLRFRAQLKGVARRERTAQVDAVMDRCMIRDVERRLVGVLSKGYRQRVGLADALLGSPALLILDEPTAGMDPNQVRAVRKLIRELGATHTILLSTHILPEVEAVCSRVVIINGGRIVATDDLRALTRGTGAVELEVVDAPEGFADVLAALPGVAGVEPHAPRDGAQVFRVTPAAGRDVREPVARAALEQRVLLRELRSVSTSLEDTFVRCTAGEGTAVVGAGTEARGTEA
jgi:ABC-2 type transport system ATP-binding protein